jgi:hypothetical protein
VKISSDISPPDAEVRLDQTRHGKLRYAIQIEVYRRELNLPLEKCPTQRKTGVIPVGLRVGWVPQRPTFSACMRYLANGVIETPGSS